MSLLNDALRAAEQRQNRPAAPGAYVGERQQSHNSRPFLLVAVVVLSLLIAIMGGYWILAGSASPEPMVVESEPSPAQAVQREVAVIDDEKPEDEPVAALEAAPQREVTVPEPKQKPTQEPEAAESETRQPEPAASPDPVAETTASKDTAKQETKPVTAEESQSEEVSTAGVKQAPETPSATDRSTARELERLVARGNIIDAERRLAVLTQKQTAPRSRYVVARALLVDGQQNQALGWLPEAIASQHPKLRLLRARAQHANSDLAAAVNTLNSNVPPVDSHAEYRVTLATLLQQQGESQEAARHWAELIAWDDSQAPWWVGLAISLEAQGEPAGAARAYRQAAELPGLPRSLADYVRQRLQALRAG